MQLILIKYGELSIKGGNRHIFINRLKKNIEALVKTNITIKKNHDRLFIITEQIPETIEYLKKIFGIQSIVIAYQSNNNQEEILKLSLEVLKKKSGDTFKVITKRADKSYPLDSNQLNNLIGTHLLKNTNLKVDVKNPQIKLKVEIRNDKAYIYTEEIKGLGGYPVGVGGKGLLLLSGGLDSPVAGFLTLKRGIDLDCLYFESPPHTTEQAKKKVIKLIKILNQYSGNINLYIANFTETQEAIYQKIPASYQITIMRRFMYKISSDFAKKNKAKVLVTGESIGQVASQTLESLVAINEVTKTPVIRPVICYDKLEIIELAKKINTYEISIEPYQDCCTIFIPKKPVIKPKLENCHQYEALIDNIEVEIKKQEINEEIHELL